jgi:hypothetical protein
MRKLESILTEELQVINIGLSSFAEDLHRQGRSVIQVDWKPMAGGDIELIRIIERIKELQRREEQESTK